MKKILAMIIVISLMAVMSVASFAEINPEDIPDDAVMYKLDMESYTIYADFEDGFVTEDYLDANVGDFGINGQISYMDPAGFGRMVGGEDALSGEVSLEARGYMDARFWSISLFEGDGDYIFIEWMWKPVCMEGTGNFAISITEADIASTASEGQGGQILTIVQTEDGRIVVKNRAKKEIAELQLGQAYKLAVAFPLGEKTYDFYVDGVLVAEGNRWLGEVASITAMRFDMNGPGWDNKEANRVNTVDWIIDDLIVTYGDRVTKADYFATPEPTPEPTATPEPTDPPANPTDPPVNPTDKPDDPAKPTDKPEEKDNKGCGQVIISSAAVMTVALLGAAIVLKKKH